jgi:rare lipoprotein A
MCSCETTARLHPIKQSTLQRPAPELHRRRGAPTFTTLPCMAGACIAVDATRLNPPGKSAESDTLRGSDRESSPYVHLSQGEAAMTLPSSRRLAALTVIACVVSGCATAPTPREEPVQGSAPDAGSSRETSPQPVAPPAPKPSSAAKTGLDRSGSKQVGKASFYADKFKGRKMADGTRMDPHDDNAASKTLPLGTTAKVTNLETGRSATVTIQDRGPYVKGRIVDLSPATAREIGITREDGVAQVEVAPLSIPQSDGTKPGGPATR